MRLPIERYGKVSITIEEEPWSASKDYDKLTILEAGEGTYKTYISRIPTPAGTPLSDRHYWIPFSRLDNNIVIDYNEFKASVIEEINNIKLYLERFYKRIENVLKDIPRNKGEYTEGERYYKSNLAQFNGSTFVADPEDYDEEDNPLAYVDWPPYDEDIEHLNPGWHIFVRGYNSETGSAVTNVAWDTDRKVLTQTRNGETLNIITAQKLKEEIGLNVTYDPNTESLTIN